MTVAAECNMDNQQTLRMIPLQEYAVGELPHGLIHYVARTRETFIKGDDDHHHYPLQLDNLKSILCFPVMRNHACRAVLYLENNMVQDAFNSQSAQIMSLLTTQMSVILENSRLEALIESEKKYCGTANELGHAKKRLEEFIDILCHELRNPLNVICVNNEFLQDLKMDPISVDHSMKECEEAISNIGSATQELKDIIDNVLLASMLENNSIKLTMEPFDPFVVTRQVCELFEEKIKEKNITLVVDLVGDLLLHDKNIVTGNAHYVRIMLINLVSNVLRCNTVGGSLLSIKCEVTSICDGTAVCKFLVNDTSCDGDDADSFANDSFHLGLKLSKELCKLMGGTITVDSKMGNGSTYCVTLFLSVVNNVIESSDSSDSSDRSEELSAPLIVNVLVVDDDPINQKILCRLLNKNGFYCVSASNGMEAIRFISEFKFDVVLMDIEMPILNGIEATKMVRGMEHQINKNVPIIGVSGRERDEAFLECGMSGYICKPYKSIEVVSAIESVLK
ncbi:hypothetical protein AKO1_015615, partial [Acrasis kona]